jgi:hypothetical protein
MQWITKYNTEEHFFGLYGLPPISYCLRYHWVPRYLGTSLQVRSRSAQRAPGQPAIHHHQQRTDSDGHIFRSRQNQISSIKTPSRKSHVRFPVPIDGIEGAHGFPKSLLVLEAPEMAHAPALDIRIVRFSSPPLSLSPPPPSREAACRLRQPQERTPSWAELMLLNHIIPRPGLLVVSRHPPAAGRGLACPKLLTCIYVRVR